MPMAETELSVFIGHFLKRKVDDIETVRKKASA
jgi:hypothetical protein